MGLLMLAASKGSFINVEISGADADAAAQALEALIVDKFGEEF
jgi:phosphocarrier protein